MKRFIIVLLSIIMVLTGCTEPEMPSEGRLIVSVDGNARGFSPKSMDAASYEIHVVNSGKNFEKTASVASSEAHMVAFNVPSGSVDVSVIARNAEGDDIGGGETKGIQVLPAKDSSVTVTVSEYQGKGTLALSVSTGNELESLTVKIYSSDDNLVVEQALEKDASTGAFKHEFTLDNGFYVMRFFSGDQEVAARQTARIVKDKTTKADVSSASFVVGFLDLTIDKSKMPSDAASYKIRVDNSDKSYVATETLSSDKYSAVVPVGDIDVVVSSYDASGRKLGEVTESYAAESGKTISDTIKMNEFTGNGRLEFSVSSTADFTSLAADVYASGSEEVLKTVPLVESNDVFTASLDVPQGFYKVVFREDGVEVAHADGLRVIQNCTSEVTADVEDSWSFNVTIKNMIDTTPSVKLSLKEDREYHVGEEFTVSAVLSNVDGTMNEWYFDNTLVPDQTGTTLVMKVPAGSASGKHVITFLTRDGSAVWSEDIILNVAKARTVYVPEFSNAYDSVGPMTRGLHTIVSDTGPFTKEPVMAPPVMMTMPVMTSLKALEDADLQLEFNREPVDFHAYGILLRPELSVSVGGEKKTAWAINDDGIFMRFDVLQRNDDGDHVVGIIDYYYSWNTQTFSYRQYFVNTLDIYRGPELGMGRHNSVMVFEILDAPVRMGSKDFSVGLLDPSTGRIRQNSHIDVFFLGDTINGVYVGDKWKLAEGYFHMKRAWVTMNSIDGVMRSYSPSYNDLGSNWKKWSDDEEFGPMLESYTKDHVATKLEAGSDQSIELKYVINGENRDQFDLKFVYDLIGRAYVHGADFIKHDVRNPEFKGSYESQAAFDAASLVELKPDGPFSDLHVDARSNGPVIFDLNKKEGATVYKYNAESSAEAVGVEKAVPQVTAFDKYYTFAEAEDRTPWNGAYDGRVRYPEFVDQLIRQHLEALGIKDKNYIENSIYFEQIKNKLKDKSYPLDENLVPDNRNPEQYRKDVAGFIL